MMPAQVVGVATVLLAAAVLVSGVDDVSECRRDNATRAAVVEALADIDAALLVAADSSRAGAPPLPPEVAGPQMVALAGLLGDRDGLALHDCGFW